MSPRILIAFVASLTVALLSAPASATHFRYGNITWTVPDPVNAPKTVRFDVTVAWRATFVDSTTLNFGDGTSNPNTMGYEIGNGFDAAGLEYKVMRYTVTHTYPGFGPYVAFFTSCCRISNLINAGDDDFRVEARVDLTPGNTGNAVTAVPAINQFQTGGIRTLTIPAVDPDDQPVSCRFATLAESGITTNPPVIPGGAAPTLAPSANPPGCTLTWNTANGLAGQQYAISIVIESSNNGVISTAFLDFIMEFVSSPPPVCTGSTTNTVQLGQLVDTVVTGTQQGGGNLKMTMIADSGTIVPAPGTVAPSPMMATYTQDPAVGQEGVHVASIIFTNPQNISGFCSITTIIPQCPGFGTPCSVGVGGCEVTGQIVCQNGNPVCDAVPGQPQAELCNGIDDDCDGTTDEDNPEAGQPCSTGLPGICGVGESTCNAGNLDCIVLTTPGTVTETCNGVDDDCNGMTDETFGVGGVCTAGVGACEAVGTYVCDGMGSSMCTAVPLSPNPESCNSIDDDCNGTVDDGFGVGDPCTVGTGACEAAGTVVCDGMGGAVCDATPGAPGTEVCGNDVDENCDGVLDDGCADGDDDGVFDEVEVAIGTDPADPDSDDDGVLDGTEPSYAEDTDGDGLVNALDVDSDDDGLFDGTELGLGCDGPGTDASKGHCRADADPSTTSDPLLADSDGGGTKDGSEDANLNGAKDPDESDANVPSDDDGLVDPDGDGLSAGLETFLGTDPFDDDSDDDGLGDGFERNPSDDGDADGLLNVLDVDSDDDGLLDGTESGKVCNLLGTDAAKGFCVPDADQGITTTSPVMKDTDRGGASDGSEDANLDGATLGGERDPTFGNDDFEVVDTDHDGLSDALEATLGTNTDDPDSDDDGVVDGQEANPSADMDADGDADVLDADSDGDGLFDGTEVGHDCEGAGTDASAGKCIPDGDGGATKTSGVIADTDGGGAIDGDEDADHDGVVDPGERDPNDPSDDELQPECATDEDCGGPTSGKICVDSICQDGCRGSGGNGCPEGQTCSSTDETPGECKTPPAPAPASSTSEDDGGCGCRTESSGSPFSSPALLGLALALAALRARRSGRSRRCRLG